MHEESIIKSVSVKLKSITSNQMVLNLLHKTAKALRKRERNFRETVSQPIMLSIDVGDWQIMKGDQNIFSLPTPMYEIWWRELSRSTNPIGDYLWITIDMGERDPHHLGGEKKCP